MPDHITSSSLTGQNMFFFMIIMRVLLLSGGVILRARFGFLAERNTVTDEIIRTFRTNELFHGRTDVTDPTSENK